MLTSDYPLLSSSGAGLNFDGINVVSLEAKVGSPFFLISEKIIQLNYRRLADSLRERYPIVRIDYSVKTNYEYAVLQTLKDLGSSLEINVSYELILAQELGFTGESMSLDGPCKTAEDFELALKGGVRLFNLDSPSQAQLLDEVARRVGVRARAAFRVNPGLRGYLLGVAERYVGKFGVPLREAIPAYEAAVRLSHVQPVGIMAHVGSQIIRPQAYLNLIDRLTLLAHQLHRRGITVEEIILGGGFPTPSLLKSSPFNVLAGALGLGVRRRPRVPPLEEFGFQISRRFAERTESLPRRPVLAIQPGRSIVSQAGILVCKVVEVKGRWVFLDVSHNSIPESSLFAERDLVLGSRIGSGRRIPVNIAGCSANTADSFGIRKRLPPLRVGDLIYILDAGAYSISRAVQYTTLTPPVYYIHLGGDVRLIRRRGAYADIVAPIVRPREAAALGPGG